MFDNDEIKYDFPWETVDSEIERWLTEDLGRGDITTDSLPLDGIKVTAELRAQSNGVLSGGGGYLRIMKKSDPDLVIDKITSDGASFRSDDVLIRITGNAAKILHAERTALNLVNHLSGIATLTSEFVKRTAGTKARIEDTRKTKPGLRALEKYAVRCGGGANHRFDLADSVLLKDNHIALVGAELEDAIAYIKGRVGHTVKIEVEVDDIDQVERAAAAGADIVMLDNMTPDDGREAVQLVGDQILIEASGGVTLDTVRAWAESGVDIISVGLLTHSAPSANLSLDFLPPERASK
jgi:nicotinate-nucleotide pyrophosphorylase (carboxylating)